MEAGTRKSWQGALFRGPAATLHETVSGPDKGAIEARLESNDSG